MSQVGPTYAYNNDSTVTPATEQKIRVLAKRDPALAGLVSNLFGVGGSVVSSADNLAGSINTSLEGIDKYSRNLIQTLFSQELAISRSIKKASEKGSLGISTATEAVTDGLDAVSSKINETMKPVSSALGSTLGTLTGIAKDPLGSITLLPRTLADVVERVNPQFAARLETTFKKYKIENLAHLPNQIMGSIRSLMTAADAILAIPLAIVNDIYQGLMDIMQEISDAVDEIISAVFDFIFGPGGLLDSILPIAEILAFLEAISELAGEIQGIANVFLGANVISGFALNVQTYAGQLNGFIQNPQNLVMSYLPQSVTQGLYTLRNPQQLINSVLPPQLSQEFSKIASMTGFGFNGNMGFGFGSVLEGLQGGVISSILSKFADQYAVLTPLLNLAGGEGAPPPINPSTPPQLQPSLTNPQVATAQGVPQPQATPAKPIADGA